MRRLKVDLQDVAIAFGDHGSELSNYLDMQTGRVVTVGADDFSEIDEDDDELREDELPEDDYEGPELPSVPDWIRAEHKLRAEVCNGLGTRYIKVPADDRREAYRDMEEFVDTVQDSRLQASLAREILGPGAFRRFQDRLSGDFHERRRWFEFKNARLEARIREWLASEVIELIEDPRDKEREEQRKAQELVDIRLDLVAAVLDFVGSVRGLPGVLRIALIGSLTTDRLDPKDADLLVTVADDADLGALAKAARRMQGRAQSSNRGADIFLLDPRGRYIGRTCQWKDCVPGIRQSCDALHCGQRHYLHDDLGAVTLPREITDSPAIELWPGLVTRVPVPQDLKAGLIDQLWITAIQPITRRLPTLASWRSEFTAFSSSSPRRSLWRMTPCSSKCSVKPQRYFFALAFSRAAASARTDSGSSLNISRQPVQQTQ